jgi:hypothetical protein
VTEIFQVGDNDLSQIMKNVCHGVLESGSSVLEDERHDTIHKSAPGGSECGFALIRWVNLSLVVAKETIHEGKNLVTSALIDNLVDKGHWKVVFGIGLIAIAKVHTDADSALFSVDRDGVGDP